MRIKNEVFQSKVQGNMLKGLINFKQYFDKSVHYELKEKQYKEKEYWKLLMLNQFQNSNLKKLELRTGFSGRNKGEIKKQIKKTTKNFLEAYREILKKRYEKYCKNEFPLVGLIFHMNKKLDDTQPEKCWQNHDEKETNELYYIKLRNSYMIQVEALNEVRNSIGGISNYILGIDAASIENNTEPWVFAPVYENARDSKGSRHLNLKSNKNKINNLGFTFHVGEDFRHIITGIRRIDEVIEHFKFHAGDRIGHGIALGIDVIKMDKQ